MNRPAGAFAFSVVSPRLFHFSHYWAAVVMLPGHTVVLLARSRGRKVINTYEDLFFLTIDSSTCTWSTWRPFIRRCGLIDDWAEDLFFIVRAALLLMIGGLWRHFIRRYERWRFKMCGMFDPLLSPEDRARAIHEFLSCGGCCKDPGCGRKMHNRFDTSAKLEALHEFMVAFFNSVPLTTAVVECFFGEIRQWLARSNRPYHSATLNAKAFLSKFKTSHEQDDRTYTGHETAYLERPVWMTKKRQFNGENISIKEDLKGLIQ